MKRGLTDSVSGSYRLLEQTVERISTHPEAGTPVAGEFHKRIVPGFPYNIIYRVWQDYIYLVAVAHHSRRPGYWRQRAYRRSMRLRAAAFARRSPVRLT